MMLKNSINTISFSKKQFKDETEFWKAIASQLDILTKTNHICLMYAFKVKDEEAIIIEYSSKFISPTNPQPYWLYPDEVVYLGNYSNKKEIEEHQDAIKELEGIDNFLNQLDIDTSEEETSSKSKDDKDGDKFDA